jgi:hypothetical protein
MVPDSITLGALALSALAAVGVYHLVSAALKLAGQARFRALDVRDPSNQLRFVMKATFAKKRVMGYSEYWVFRSVEAEVAKYRGHRVFAQTSLGEILQTPDPRARKSVNSKRVDILVVAPSGYPVLVVEYHGGGHYQNNAAARDAVKKEALRKAHVEYLEVSSSHAPEEIASLVRAALGRATSQPNRGALPWGSLRGQAATVRIPEAGKQLPSATSALPPSHTARARSPS